MELLKKLNSKILIVCAGISMMYFSFMITDQLAPDAANRVSKIRELELIIADLENQLYLLQDDNIHCQNNLYDKSAKLACWQNEFELIGCEDYPAEKHVWNLQRRKAQCRR